MPMISFQKLTEQGRRSDGTLKNLGKDCRGGYSWQLPQAINKYRPLHLTFLSNLSSLPMKTTGHVLGFFHHRKFAGSLLVKILLAHSLSHAIQSR